MDLNVLTNLTTVKRLFDIMDRDNIKPGTKAFLEAMTEVRFSDGQDIVKCGEEADDGMYFIVTGQADVFSSTGDLLNQLQEGDVIGELALINDEPRAATVRAVGEVVCANITRELFEEIVIANRKIIGSFMSMLYRRTTQLLAEKEQIVFVSEHDQLTGLFNKGKYLSLYKNDLKNLESIAIYNMDVNNLKKLNDNFGHEAGDKLLIKAADSIKAVSDNRFYGFRMGGDEYLMLGFNVTKEEAEERLAMWEKELAKLNTLDDGIECIVAVGLVYGEKPYDYDAMFKQADELMYEDKKKKKKPGEEIR